MEEKKKDITYWYFHWLQAEVAGRFEGFRPGSEPVGGECCEGAHAHERVGGQAADVLPKIIQLGNPQLSQDFLSLHDCSVLSLQGNTGRKITMSGNYSSLFCTSFLLLLL